MPRAAPAPVNSTQASGRCRRRGVLRPGPTPGHPAPREGGGLLGVPRSREEGAAGAGAHPADALGSTYCGQIDPAARVSAHRAGRGPSAPCAAGSPLKAGPRRPGPPARGREGRCRGPPPPGPGRPSGDPRPSAPSLSPPRALAAFELLTFCQLPSDGETKTNTFFLGQWLFPVPAQKDGGGAATIQLGGERQARVAPRTPQMSPQNRGWLGSSLEGALGLSLPALPFALTPRVGGGRGRVKGGGRGW